MTPPALDKEMRLGLAVFSQWAWMPA